MKRIILSVWLLYALAAGAQTTDWQESLRQWMTAEDMEESYGQETMEMLAEQAEAKINLNQTSREELEQLPFLTAQQVESIVEYIYRYGPVRTTSELQMITSLDYETRRLLQCFVYVGEEKARRVWPAMEDIVKYGKSTLTATGKIPFYDRKGDRNGYMGYKYRHDVRYQFTFHDRIKFGLTGAQDAGEPFFSSRNSMGYDHYSYYFQLRKMGKLEALNIGMYRVQLGMGLVMNTGYNFGKLATLQSMGRSTHALTAHSSRSQANYLQGAAATVALSDHWRTTAYVSYRYVDGTLNDNGTLRTLLTDGYHRTPTEMEKKNNTKEVDAGMSVGWHHGTLHVNGNVVYTHFDRRLIPQKTSSYQHYAAEGNDFANISIDYGYNNSRLGIAGETAINREGALAMIHTLNYRLTDATTLMVLHRYYDKRYTALHARSFSEGGHVQNEHGLYAGITWKPSRSWLLTGYADYAHFSWPRYQISTASDAFDMLVSCRHNRRQWTWEGRYRLHIRQHDNSDKTLVENRPEHRVRLRATLDLADNLQLQTQADGSHVRRGKGSSSGIMVSQQASWQGRHLKVNGLVGWFHTDDYNTRIYQYERSVLHDFSFPAYYGHGLRYSLMARADYGPLTATAKLGVTNYFDRNSISSGLQTIDHSAMTDLLLQVRWTF